MRIHILGVCGTFMGGLALIARQLGHEVTGSDQHVYPPMSDTLRAAGINIMDGYDPAHLRPAPELVIVGNTIARTNPALEFVLNKGIHYTSGPDWLFNNVLMNRHVLAVSGTHGKTTTTSLLTWILARAGRSPGYLIGGVAHNFPQTAALGKGNLFVIEADEYDSSFLDKRSKFMHYRPRTLVINNLEYDHADIFPDLEAIKKQFQYLLRAVPAGGCVIYPCNDAHVEDVLQRGCWASKQTFGVPKGGWQARHQSMDGSHFELYHRDQRLGMVNWSMIGQHNVQNALAAAAAAHDIGIVSSDIINGLNSFKGVKRRLELRGTVGGVNVYDDFAHHPTAIETTITGLRAKVGAKARIIAVLQFGSNTMRQGTHADVIGQALQGADRVELLRPEGWDLTPVLRQLEGKAMVHADASAIVNHLAPQLHEDDHVLVMSNKGFDGIHQKLLDRLEALQQTKHNVDV